MPIIKVKKNKSKTNSHTKSKTERHTKSKSKSSSKSKSKSTSKSNEHKVTVKSIQKIDKRHQNYLLLLQTIQKNKMALSILSTKLSGSSRKYLANAGYYFIKNQDFRKEIITVVKNNYDALIQPYKDINTQNWKPNKFESSVIKITNEVYNKKRNNNIGGFKYLIDDSTPHMAIYSKKTFWKQSQTILISFRGSHTKEDIIPDIYIALNKHSISNRFNKSMKQCDDIIAKYPDASIYLTGHSLGGAIVFWIRQHRDYMVRGYAFNPGYNGYYNNKMNLNYPNLKVAMVKGDLISNTLLAIPKSHQPSQKNLIVLEGDLRKPVQNHSMQNFLNLT